ncbi:right-handed parallel beta-helix repeat-containing protein [Peribacillus sp. NPDC006672]|uniref:right-handed parallel beta-helix repeat-containing protein n=1 Tax=Peribacillus sp. NPDC006672 TaxID=3390606 RepID=UPI003CFEFE5F
MKIFKMALFFLVLSFCLPSISEASGLLQARVDRASAGATIEIEEGVYEESIVLSKPITLKGKGEVVIRSCVEQPIITIEGKHVSLQNIKVEQCSDVKKSTAISVMGSNHNLQNLYIDTTQFGIKLDGAQNVMIQNSEIIGKQKGNGIDLWESNNNTIRNMKISRVVDGIYLEQSHDNSLKGNSLSRSRYGLHLMYSNNNLLKENVSKGNMTGTMLMEAKGTSVLHNEFSNNKDNVNAQGLLMYYVTGTEIIRNQMTENRVGIYMENSQKNLLKSNKLTDNFIGIQFNKANENKVTLNTFVGNVNEAQAIESSKNGFIQNYWDASAKIDTRGKGTSAIAFTADPYFLTLTKDVPEYQLFFQAPGLTLLQKMLKSPESQLLKDPRPLMHPSVDVEKETSSSPVLWTISAFMVFLSLLLFIFGRKRI